MLVTRTSQYSGIERTFEMPVTADQMRRFSLGENIGTVFPHLSAADREFILTGITDEEWKAMFPPEEDE